MSISAMAVCIGNKPFMNPKHDLLSSQKKHSNKIEHNAYDCCNVKNALQILVTYKNRCCQVAELFFYLF